MVEDSSMVLRIKQKRAVIVGINNYLDENIGDLNFCVNDIKGFHDILIDGDRGQYSQEDVQLLVDDAQDSRMLPTRSNIMASLRTLAKSSGEGDSILFFFSGHGLEQDKKYYLLPSDARIGVLTETAVSLSWIRQTLEEADARAKVVIFDACHAGIHIGKAVVPMSKRFHEELFFEGAEGFAILSSCKMNELSYEWPQKNHGVFTFYLTEGLKGAADLDKDGSITVSEISRYTAERVKVWAFRKGVEQNPSLDYRVSGDITLVQVPAGYASEEGEGISQEQKSSEELIRSVSLKRWVKGYEMAMGFMKRINGNLLSFFSPTQITKDGFPLGRVETGTASINGQLQAYVSTILDYDKGDGETLEKVIGSLSSLFGWHQIQFGFKGIFDINKLVSLCRDNNMMIASYEPSKGHTFELETLVSGWGTSKASLTFANGKESSTLTIQPTSRIFFDGDFYTQINPKNISSMIKDVFARSRKKETTT